MKCSLKMRKRRISRAIYRKTAPYFARSPAILALCGMLRRARMCCGCPGSKSSSMAKRNGPSGHSPETHAESQTGSSPGHVRAPGGKPGSLAPAPSATRSATRSGTPSATRSATAIPDKLYFRIGEVAELCRVETYVLRFWQTEFPQLRPGKSGTGQRLYRKRDVEMALKIKRLLHDEGYTIVGAKSVLSLEAAVPARLRLQPELPLPNMAEAEARGQLEQVRQSLRRELRDLLGMLDRKPSGTAQPKDERPAPIGASGKTRGRTGDATAVTGSTFLFADEGTDEGTSAPTEDGANTRDADGPSELSVERSAERSAEVSASPGKSESR
jgi:DNA-binding transcriptional MerR regulator